MALALHKMARYVSAAVNMSYQQASLLPRDMPLDKRRCGQAGALLAGRLVIKYRASQARLHVSIILSKQARSGVRHAWQRNNQTGIGGKSNVAWRSRINAASA